MQTALLSPTRRAIAGAVVLLVAVGLIGTELVLRPAGQAQATATAASVSTISVFSVFSSASASNGSEAKTYYVEISCGAVAVCTNGFNPKNLTIPAGSMVTWTSVENPELYVYHRVVFRVGGIDSGRMNGEQTFTTTFLSPGVFQYYDAYYPENNGTIIVVPSNSTGG